MLVSAAKFQVYLNDCALLVNVSCFFDLTPLMLQLLRFPCFFQQRTPRTIILVRLQLIVYFM